METYWHQVIHGKKGGVFTRFFLRFLSFFYYLIISLRNFFYDYLPFLSKKGGNITVVSVGNLTLGGMGKTPLTCLLAKKLAEKKQVAILSRGYRRKGKEYLIVKEGVDVEKVGDEPFLMKQKVSQAVVIVGKDRVKSSMIAASKGAKIAILDDGMQHRKIKRDFEIVMIDSQTALSKHCLFPRGVLREGLTSLKRADLICLRKDQYFSKCRKNLLKYTNAPVIGFKIVAQSVKKLKKDIEVDIKGKKVALFCGIANPERFISTVRLLGGEIIDHLFLQDHKTPTFDRLKKYFEKAKEKGALYLICTEKDRVKLLSKEYEALPIVWVEVSIHISDNADHFDRFIDKIATFSSS